MRPEADDPTAPEPQAASLRVAGPCRWGMVVMLHRCCGGSAKDFYLGSSLPSPVAYQEQGPFHSFLHVCVCVVCVYVLMFI